MPIVQCPSLALQACCKRLPRHRLHSRRRSIWRWRINETPGIADPASSPHELVAGKPANQPFQLQNAERGQDLRGSQAGAGDQLINADGMVVELAEQGSLLVAEAKLGRGARRNGTTGALAGADLAEYNLVHSVVKCCHETILKKLAGWQAESRGDRWPRSRRLNR